MNIGIIVNSQTGHTLEVCEALRDRLIEGGHVVEIERVTVSGDGSPNPKAVQLDRTPHPKPYDGIVFAAWVEAFSLCRIMSQYLKQIDSLSDKLVACMVTQQFPFPWMGGNRSVRQLKRLCESKGSTVVGTAIINWAKSRRDTTMSAAIENLSKRFSLK